MKFGFKAIALAVTLAIASTGAQAAIDSPAGGAAGELFLTVWDTTASNEASYNIGLNLTTATFNGAGSYTFSNLFSDASFTAFFDAANVASQSNWKWNIVGASDYGDASKLLSTTNGAVGTLLNSAVDNAASATTLYVGNLACTGSCNTAGTNLPASNKYAGDFWGNNFAGAAGVVNNAAAIGTSLGFFSALNTVLSSDFSDDLSGNATQSTYAYQWNLDSTGTLTYNAASAPAVPLPAAVWLLGSGLMGMFGVSRRRAIKAA